MNRRKRMMESLDQDIRDYIERETQDNIERGLPPEEARYAALRKFGNVARAKEDTWEVWSFGWLEQLWQEIRYGLRQLAKNPGFTFVAVLTLALGIGANTAIFSLIDAVMLRMLPVHKPEELVELRLYNPKRGGQGSTHITNPLWEQLRDRQDVFSGIFAAGDEPFDLAQGGAVQRADGLFVSGSYFETLRVQPAAGRLLTRSDDQRGCPAIAVLSYGFWQEHYGGAESAVGQTISLDEHPFQIVGASAAGFFGTEVGSKFDVAIPICTARVFDEKEQRLDHRSWWWLRVMARVKPGTNQDQLKARLAALSPQINAAALPLDWPDDGKQAFLKQTFVTNPASSGVSSLRRQFTQPLDVLMAVVGLVLLIACANIASLMLARATARQREIAVRLAMGASRMRLVRQLLTECVMLSAAGALVGILFARWCSALLVRYISTTGNQVFLDLSPDWRVLGFTGAMAVLTGILCGALPALHSTRVSLMSAMKSRGDSGQSLHFRTSKWIVAAQVALSLVLLVSAGLLLRSFERLATLDIGFDRNNVLLVNVNLGAAKVPDERRLEMYRQLENRLRALPGVISASRSWNTPISRYEWSNDVKSDAPNPPTGDAAEVYFNSISPTYFETLRSPILAGRAFNEQDSKGSPPVAIINQAMARRFYPNLNPLGRFFTRFHVGKPEPPTQIVGLVRDAKYESLKEETYPTAFFPVAQQTPGHDDEETYELRTDVLPASLASAVQAAVASENKEISLSFRTLAQQVNDSMVQERLLAALSGFFGALALLLAMIGLYGTLSYLVTQRQTEFGIRMALGAGPSLILRLVMRDLGTVLAGGVFGGIVISLAATRLLNQMLFSLNPSDPVTLLGAAGMLSAVALLAGYLPARRATKVDPMVALRYE